MKLKLTLPVLMLAASSAAVAADDCGEVTIAEFSWQSAEVLAQLDALILERGFGCSVSVVAGDTVPTITSMVERGQPDIIPEAAVELLPQIAARGVEEGRIVSLGDSIPEGALEGWYIPQYLADTHPDIRTVADALAHPELFPAPEDRSKGGILVGPQGWGGTVVSTQLFQAFDAEAAGFILVETGSAAGLDGAISRAYEQQRGFLTYYWSPTSLMARYPLFRLDGGVPRDDEEWARCTTVSSCADPQPNYWVASPFLTLVTDAFQERAGAAPVIDYLRARSWDTATVSELMVWMTDNQGTGAEGALHFLRTQPEIWTPWVPADVAERIAGTL